MKIQYNIIYLAFIIIFSLTLSVSLNLESYSFWRQATAEPNNTDQIENSSNKKSKVPDYGELDVLKNYEQNQKEEQKKQLLRNLLEEQKSSELQSDIKQDNSRSNKTVTNYETYDKWIQNPENAALENVTRASEESHSVLYILLISGIAAGISKAFIMVVQGLKNHPLTLNELEESDVRKEALKRLMFIFQGIWVFIALLMVTGHIFKLSFDGFSMLENFVFLLCLSFPVITIHAGNWLMGRETWPLWVVAIGGASQLVVITPVYDYFYHNEAFWWVLIAMALLFALFYATQNFVMYWNMVTKIWNIRMKCNRAKSDEV